MIPNLAYSILEKKCSSEINILCLGHIGSGKTSFIKALHQHLGYNQVSLDIFSKNSGMKKRKFTLKKYGHESVEYRVLSEMDKIIANERDQLNFSGRHQASHKKETLPLFYEQDGEIIKINISTQGGHVATQKDSRLENLFERYSLGVYFVNESVLINYEKSMEKEEAKKIVKSGKISAENFDEWSRIHDLANCTYDPLYEMYRETVADMTASLDEDRKDALRLSQSIPFSQVVIPCNGIQFPQNYRIDLNTNEINKYTRIEEGDRSMHQLEVLSVFQNLLKAQLKLRGNLISFCKGRNGTLHYRTLEELVK
ncbi:MAG: hypothetical protein VX028_03185 [Nanoarchaeota archaeon]|nr:hypothetical protein [Nanoarchaeota archaeon]